MHIDLYSSESDQKFDSERSNIIPGVRKFDEISKNEAVLCI